MDVVPRVAPSVVAPPDLTIPLPDWHADAVCVSADPSAFFPEKGEPAGPAVAICQVCPVQGDCLQEAMEFEAGDLTLVVGVRGGLTPNERRELLRQHQAA